MAKTKRNHKKQIFKTIKMDKLEKNHSLHSNGITTWFAVPGDPNLDQMGGKECVQEISIYNEINKAISNGFAQIKKLENLCLTCFLILLHRHSNQSSVSICVDLGENKNQTLFLNFEEVKPFNDAYNTVLKLTNSLTTGKEVTQQNEGSIRFIYRDVRNGGDITDESIRAESISLILINTGESILVRFKYNSRLYSFIHIQEMISQYTSLLRQVIESPQKNIYEYSLITDFSQKILPDPKQLIEKPEYPLLTESYSEISIKYPDKEAVSYRDSSWTYAQLYSASTKLAHYLYDIGVAKGEAVAITGKRSFGMVCSILGVLQSGGSILTLDPKLPAERKKTMCQQANVRYLLVIGEFGVEELKVGNIIQIDEASGCNKKISGYTSTSELPKLDPLAPAYIFYTSGSTGMPKGVVGTQQGMAHFLNWQRKTFKIDHRDRAAQTTALSFDMILRDMFLVLTSGATLCIPEEKAIFDPAVIIKWMVKEKISVLHIVPSLLRAWLNNFPEGLQRPSFRHVFLAGEPLTDVLIQKFYDLFGKDALLTNFYGPTETTMIKCYHSIDVPEPGNQPIGIPQPETQVLVFNCQNKLCGINEMGQLAIRTPFRTLGYLNAPEKTSSVFVPNPFNDDSQDLIYLTGDSGYYRSDGLLIMCGRMDNQVKIRGVRVEPGEVESVVARCPGVRESAVVVQEKASGDKTLVCFVVLDSSKSESISFKETVSSFLKERLPENMIPSNFEVLAELPMLPNGKVDRKDLATRSTTVGLSGARAMKEEDLPQNDQEEQLLSIWKSVLGFEQISVNDSFVELGGDSLTAITALVRMQKLGIPNHFAKGIFQGWSIRQITQLANGKVRTSKFSFMTLKVKTNLLVNVMRGIIVFLVVWGHWNEGLLNRLPVPIEGLHKILTPFFNIATPGFALLFGLSLGYVYLPKYLLNSHQTRKSLYLGGLIIFIGIVIRSVALIITLKVNGYLNTSTDFFNTFYSVLLYYAVAIISVPIWFKIILRFKNKYWGIFFMALSSYIIHQILQHTLALYEQEGFLQLIRLFLTAKFSFFYMMFGTLLGMAAGVYLNNWSKKKERFQSIVIPTAKIGFLTSLLGLGVLYMTTGNLDGLWYKSLAEWKWIFYGGVIILVSALLAIIISNYEKLTRPFRVSVNIIGVLGQISLPVFIFHMLVIRIKTILVFVGLPDKVAILIPLLLFLFSCYWLMSMLYKLYYDELSENDIQKYNLQDINAV